MPNRSTENSQFYFGFYLLQSVAGGECREGARDVSDFALVIAVLSSLGAKHEHKQNIRFIPSVPQIPTVRVRAKRTCVCM